MNVSKEEFVKRLQELQQQRREQEAEAKKQIEMLYLAYVTERSRRFKRRRRS